ncbi:non-homologous end joining protein Ku [Glycomyces algeriensis]|uniref:Non-homologous end joining protein Ku n=2 Tax=Glycomyces algeriensis TaxID=256037 RepID=A0A9W6LJG6_9ACTN|nr:non-homologous end joining protein Ku [Glycomyces algeriensis]
MLNTTIEMGLVRIPVKVYAATGSHDRAMRQFHADDGGRIRYEKVCELDDEPVDADEIRKGVEDGDGNLVLLDEDDLASLPVRSSKHVDVLMFVKEGQVDPILYDKAYYLGPGAEGTGPYLVLRDAMAEKGLVALVTITLRQRESLAIIRPAGEVLVLDRLLWADEVRIPEITGADAKADKAELEMAQMLIDMRTGDWDPEQYSDEYQAALDELIEAKAAGRPVPKGKPKPQAKVTNILDALQRSVEAADPGRKPPATARKRTAKKAAKKATRRTAAKKTTKAAARKRSSS